MLSFKVIAVEEIILQLQSLGLTKQQADIYLALFKNGTLRIQAISEDTNTPRTSVYAGVKKLLSLGVIEEITEDGFKKIRALPLLAMKLKIKDTMSQLQAAEATIDDLAKKLEFHSGLSSPEVAELRYYKNRTGARQLLWNTLKAKDVVYVYSAWGRSQFVGTSYYANFVEESAARGIKEAVIVNADPKLIKTIVRELSSPTSRTPLGSIWNSSLHIQGETFIYNDIYAQVYLSNDVIHGFEIQSQQFVNAQRSIFEALLKSAQPVKES